MKKSCKHLHFGLVDGLPCHVQSETKSCMARSCVMHVQALVQDAVLKFKRKPSDAPSTPQEPSTGDPGRKRTEGEEVQLLASQPEFSDCIPMKETHGTLLGRPSLQERHSLV